MPKLIIFQDYRLGERKELAAQWVAESLDTRLSTQDPYQAAVWIRDGYDVAWITNAFDGAVIEVRNRSKNTGIDSTI